MSNSKFFSVLAASIVILLSTSLTAYSQPQKGMAGIGIRFGTPAPYYGSNLLLNTIEIRPDIVVPVWVTEKIKIEPSIGFLNYDDLSFWRLGVSFSSHFPKGNSSPYFAFNANMWATSHNGTSSDDYVFGVGGGEEYFFSSNFSLSGEAQLNFSVYDKAQTIFVRRNVVYSAVQFTGRFYF